MFFRSLLTLTISASTLTFGSLTTANAEEASCSFGTTKNISSGLASEKVKANFEMLNHSSITDLAKDPTLKIDSCGVGIYEEQFKEEKTSPAQASSELSPTEAITATEAFNLSSDPTASFTLYLDFTGGEISNTYWNDYLGEATITYESFSIDDDSNNFSSEELTAIKNIYDETVEDYAPYRVNITTKEPSSDKLVKDFTGDSQFGMTLNFTKTHALRDRCGCGGIASLKSFNFEPDLYNYFNTGWVFNKNVVSSYAIGHTASHEFGHLLGLHHDGVKDNTTTLEYFSGDSLWTPIMGSDVSEAALTQWSKGEYKNANNQEDDTAIIASTLGTKNDDYANTIGAATLITQGSYNGILGSNDKDFFKFTAQGQTNIFVSLPPYTDLDLALKLYNSQGSLIASDNLKPQLTSNPEQLSGLDAFLNKNLTVGETYYLSVEGVGNQGYYGNYTSYGSMGAYTLTLETNSSANTLAFNSRILPIGYEQQPYNARPGFATGGVQPYSYASPNLPSGLTLDPVTGALSGAPEKWGYYNVNIRAYDSAGSVASKTIALNVNIPDVFPDVAIKNTTLANGTVGKNFYETLEAEGGNGFYEWTATGLPSGIVLKNNELAGVSTKAGVYDVTITATSWNYSYQNTQTKTYKLTIIEPAKKVIFSTAKLPAAKYKKSYKATVKTKNMLTSTEVAFKGKLPNGIRAVVNKNTGVITFSGKPTVKKSFKFTIVAKNANLTAQKTYTIKVS